MSTHAKPLCPTAICEIGRLGDDRAVGAPRLTSASAPMLECSSSTTAATIRRPDGEPAARGDRAAAANHRGDAALHVLRAAAVEPAVALDRRERIGMPARRRCRCGRRTSACVPLLRPSSTPTTLGRPGATVSTDTSRPMRAHLGGDGIGDLRSPGAPGTASGSRS